jgi:pyridoxal phosphate enzyme (YggS family)
MQDSSTQQSAIADRLKAVQEQVVRTAESAGRNPSEIELIAVTKTRGVETIQAAIAAGQKNLGENRVQEMAAKQPELPEATWHLIGPLQRNKVKYIAEFVAMVHTLDSVKLLKEIDKQAAKVDRVIPCLIQVNISGEEQKSGTDTAGLEAILEALPDYPHVQVQGLMGIAELTEERSRIQEQFAQLRQLYESYKQQTVEGWYPRHLSMGMSGDYDLAIAEGATLIRVGSAIFGPRS